MPLRVPIRDVNRARLQQLASSALRQIANTLHVARISAKARVGTTDAGRPRIVVYVQSRGSVEASLLLRPFIHGFEIKVV